ncbi:phosphatase PAP2 family protein [Kitasatospora sp. NBC_00240]|uniref:phosphatase PAP2 family protein n=1 Tax=Kitasatospora sp. NBC_00240 TaxID=2903567 RepID=UPI002251DD56|nr:phosphatase PAP2 family protein [Kitasatospora sp. NBC_00240]MCX5212827.1 phosphatase PAP2 family protein [Kitasatospora sp. NBC_00240]
MVLGLISWQVAVDGPLLGLDRWARQGVRELRHGLSSPLIDHLGALLSDLGGSVPAVPVLLGGGALAAWRARRAGARRWWLPLPAAVLTAGAIPLLIVPAKASFARPGPLGLPLTPEQWGWYPSGHTATASVAYGAAALLLGRTVGIRHRRRLYAGAGLLSAGVGVGLVWSDYHWLLDVVASWCLAGLVLPLVALLSTRPRPTAPGGQGGVGRGGPVAPRGTDSPHLGH